MAFGQQNGPPASAKQMAYLLSLLQEAGFDSFRDARHPLGLTQRQAGGKFTGREASELIDRLLAGEVGDPSDDEPPSGGGNEDRPPPDPSTIRTWGAGSRDRSRRPTAEERAEANAARAQARLDDQRGELLAGLPADLLVAELERRGWRCSPPPDRR